MRFPPEVDVFTGAAISLGAPAVADDLSIREVDARTRKFLRA